MSLSPMMQQYLNIKEQHKDALLFYRLGDFYEMFFDDAKTASRELELVLTGRDCGLEERAPMCGVPYHSCDAYISRLVARGYKVAICEQMADPSSCKGIVPREITRIITPGTVTDGNMLDESCNNYLACIFSSDNEVGLCFLDASTGVCEITQLSGEDVEARLISEVGRYLPKEIIINYAVSSFSSFVVFLKNKVGCLVEQKDDEYFNDERVSYFVDSLFSRQSIGKDVLNGHEYASLALGGSLRYLSENQKNDLQNITSVFYYSDQQYMQLDINARRNLELTGNIRTRDKRGSLLWVLDRTRTPMGKRLIRSWIEQPLLNPAQICKRQNAVAELYSDPVLCDDLSDSLTKIYDIERIMTKVVCGSANPKELVSLAYALSSVPSLKQRILSCNSELLCTIYEDMDELFDVVTLINESIAENPPLVLKDGGVIRKGYNADLDLLLDDRSFTESVISKIEAEEKLKTGIKTLKVGYNRVFGYYIEVSNSFKNLVPDHYIRKQTLTNGERYITEELKELEGKVLGAKQRAVQLEYELFSAVRTHIAAQYGRIQSTARAIAMIDVLRSLADVARKNNYCMPTIGTSGRINIKDGRHPVVEKMIDAPFVPNDTLLDSGENRCSIITGPNMAGKSTFMRQTALIVIMAQIGSFVPATSAEIDIVDAVYTRVGASDDLAGGQSTFMVEMSEVAYILNNATKDSLLVFDEIGRGTSTYDGMSIARAVLEFVSDKKRIGAKTLFATHYHELTELEDMLDGVKNYNIAAKKRGYNITFLRRIVRGGADDSYGIEVAKLAGVPDGVVKRAKDILASIVKKDISFKNTEISESSGEDIQISFTDTRNDGIIERLSMIDVNTLTPIEAMSVLYELCKEAKKS